MVKKMGRVAQNLRLTPERVTIGKLCRRTPAHLYWLGGGYCTKCSVVFSFMELYLLLLENRERGLTTGMPQCPYCSNQIRTSPRKTPRTQGNFWKWVDYFEKEK